MIVSFILRPFWLFIRFLVGLELDFFTTIPNWYGSFQTLMRIGLSVFPADVWAVVMVNLVFWLGFHLIGAVIHWIYNKIPGIN